jgi:thymidylate synthase (FAD)
MDHVGLVENVLDHGFVRLVDNMGDDLSVVRAARVSYDAAWRAGEDEKGDEKLIRFLWNNKHTTPFEAVTFTFEVKAPIFVFRQWHRHRTFSYNELSARYKRLPEEYYLPDPKLVGIQAVSNKQGRQEAPEPSKEFLAQRENEVEAIRDHCQAAFLLYKELLAQNWPRELARSVLPVNTYSHMFCTVNLLNLLKFLTLRCDSHAQYEIRVYADAMLKLIRMIVPVCVSAWEQK